LEMVRRTTPEAGSSTSRRPTDSPSPDARGESPDGLLLENNERVTL
jgi:hypothetical protein